MIGFLKAAKALMGVLAVTFACIAPAYAEKILNRSTSNEPSTLDPHLALGNSSSVIIDDLFVGLMTTDASGQVAYGVAKSHTLDDGGQIYTFTLRDDAVWSDGKPITSADVVYSFHRLMAPETAARYAGNLYFLKNGRAVNTGQAPVETLGVTAPDAKTVVIELEKPVPFFLKVLAGNALALVPQQSIEAHGNSWARPGNIVVNGAYDLTGWTPGTKITLTKNNKFWDASKVSIDEVRYFPTQDLGTVIKQFRANEIDIALGFPPEQYPFLQKNYAKQINISPNLGLFYWVLNTQKAPFDDVRVRKALYISIDRDAIAEKLLRGLVDPAWGVVPPASEDYTPPAFPYATVPFAKRQAEARALLAEAGYSAKNPLKFKLRYDVKEEVRQISVAMAAMWRQVGVEAELISSDFRAITNDVRKGDFDVIRYQWYAPYDDPTTFLNLVVGGSRTNFSKINYAPYNELLVKAEREADPAERAKILQQAEAEIMDQYPIIPIYFPKAKRMISDRVIGWKNIPDGNIPTQYLDLKP
ncbi:MAG: peptide ABC transporter substrate-binding protein [Parvularculaceae bacterium]